MNRAEEKHSEHLPAGLGETITGMHPLQMAVAPIRKMHPGIYPVRFV
jgi:hypothetical protein